MPVLLADSGARRRFHVPLIVQSRHVLPMQSVRRSESWVRGFDGVAVFERGALAAGTAPAPRLLIEETSHAECRISRSLAPRAQ
jgi:hypothetical protein